MINIDLCGRHDHTLSSCE